MSPWKKEHVYLVKNVDTSTFILVSETFQIHRLTHSVDYASSNPIYYTPWNTSRELGAFNSELVQADQANLK